MMKNHNLYLKSNDLLLADVLQKFRTSNLKSYKLFPSHYLSAPVLIWDAIIRMKKFELELTSDTDMNLVF